MNRRIITLLALTLIAAAGLPGLTSAAPHQWVSYEEPVFGARLTYPSDLFRALQRPAGSIDYRFASRDGKVVLAFASWSNTGGNSLPQFKSEALSKSRHTDLTYQPGGRNWFVVSGYNGDTIYYEKVMITCQGKTISAFGMRYPIAQRDRYDHVVERIEDTFVPGRNCHKQETQRRVAE